MIAMRNCLLELRLLLREKLLWGFLAAFLALNLLLVHLNLPGANAGWELDELLPELLALSLRLLYHKLLPAVLAESLFLCFWTVLAGLERERVARTVPISYSTRVGRGMAKNRIAAGLICASLAWIVLFGAALACFLALCPARESLNLSFSVVEWPDGRPWYGSLPGHVAACGMLLWGILLAFGLLAGAAGLLFRNAFSAFLSLAALAALWLLSVRFCPGEPAAWQWPLVWNPANILFRFEDGQLILRLDAWLLRNDGACLSSLEPETVGTWALIGAGLFCAAWRGFCKKEM